MVVDNTKVGKGDVFGEYNLFPLPLTKWIISSFFFLSALWQDTKNKLRSMSVVFFIQYK